MGAKLSDSGADWDLYSSQRPGPAKRLKIDAREALRRIRQIAGLEDVRVEDWRTADTPEAAAERAKFEKEQGE